MDKETKRQLEEAHKKAMEGIQAFNKELRGTTDAMHDYFGVPKNLFKKDK